MLQQTQVSRVMSEYYFQFLEKFPSLQTLSLAKEEDVLAAWSGLGYYSRARNLHSTAKLCQTALPTTEQELLKLPGIGRYTASAICSFAYNQNVAVVDTNIARVIRRFFALDEASDVIVWQYAKEFVNSTNPTQHNQALMDLGALVCLPNNPECVSCPLTLTCKAKDAPELYTKTKKIAYEALELFLGVTLKEDKIALELSRGPMYKGMLQLPHVEPIEDAYIAEFKHSYTKYRLTVKLYKVETLPDDAVWLEFDELKNAHISSLTKKALLHVRDLEL